MARRRGRCHRLRRRPPSPSLRDREDIPIIVTRAFAGEQLLARYECRLDPGSTTSALRWIPDQVRDDECLETTSSGPKPFASSEVEMPLGVLRGRGVSRSTRTDKGN